MTHEPKTQHKCELSSSNLRVEDRIHQLKLMLFYVPETLVQVRESLLDELQECVE